MKLTLIYWVEDNIYCGYLREVPGVNGQGTTLKRLEANVLSGYNDLLALEDENAPEGAKEKSLQVSV